MNANKQTLGFWFSYVESLTALAVIFLILFVFAANREIIINKQQAQLVKSWQLAKEKLNNLNVAPEKDSKMGGIRLTIADSLFFSINSFELKPDGIKKIIKISDVLIEFFNENPNFQKLMRIKVGGHTDKIGGDNINFPLSYQRAYNVSNLIRNIFNEKNIDVDIVPIAYGSKYPLPGHDSEIEPKNRRITIVIEFLSTELLSELN